MRLEDVTAGAQIFGVAGDAPVTVVAVTWIGGNALRLTYRTDAAGSMSVCSTAIMSRAWNWPSEVLLTT